MSSPTPISTRRGRRSSGAVTLHDVAKLAGVAPITASRAVNTPDQVSDEVRRKVLDAIARTGYVPNLLAGFDLFALATEQEASGTVYVEAEAAGLPVIGTDVGGVSEMMRDGVTGILVPVHDHAALQSALERLIDNPELRRQMGEAGRRMVWEEGVFSPARLAENTEAIYRKWLAERRS